MILFLQPLPSFSTALSSPSFVEFLTSGLFSSTFSISVHPPSSKPSPALLSHPSLCCYFASHSHPPHSVLDPGCLLHSPLCQAVGSTKGTGEATSSSQCWSSSRAEPLKEQQPQVKVVLCSKIFCTEQVQSADRDKHPLPQKKKKIKNSALNQP